jgi:hypothetical protein
MVLSGGDQPWVSASGASKDGVESGLEVRAGGLQFVNQENVAGEHGGYG